MCALKTKTFDRQHGRIWFPFLSACRLCCHISTRQWNHREQMKPALWHTISFLESLKVSQNVTRTRPPVNWASVWIETWVFNSPLLHFCPIHFGHEQLKICLLTFNADIQLKVLVYSWTDLSNPGCEGWML